MKLFDLEFNIFGFVRQRKIFVKNDQAIWKRMINSEI